MCPKCFSETHGTLLYSVFAVLTRFMNSNTEPSSFEKLSIVHTNSTCTRRRRVDICRHLFERGGRRRIPSPVLSKRVIIEGFQSIGVRSTRDHYSSAKT